MRSSVYLFELESCKMSKFVLPILTIYLTALFSSGVALSCIQCSEYPGGTCGLTEEGTSVDCPAGICTLIKCSSNVELNTITKLCGKPECASEVYAKNSNLTSKTSVLMTVIDCNVHFCDGDDCNADNGSTMNHISMIM